MTDATAIRHQQVQDTKATIFYQVAMRNPQSHLFEVTLEVNNWQESVLNLKMPVWTPGSYLVREYARHIQNFQGKNGETQESLSSKKVSKNHWQLDTTKCSKVRVEYRVFANDLTVRTNHLDSTHGYFNGAALFFFIPQYEQQPVQLKIIPPQADWIVSTPLKIIDSLANIFEAEDFDTLVDSPVEIGTQKIYDFQVFNKPHQFAIWGEGNAKAEQIIQDTTKIIEFEAQLFDGLPYDKYLFLLHLSGSGYGGLEHKDACTLNYPRFGFRDRDKYNRFLQLVAHEFFHLWNVKRIRPKALEQFDYETENYTTSLWFCEGTTSYYDILIPVKAGIYKRKTFLKNISKDITRYLTTPGRNVQPLGESSYDAWIKLYRRDANSDNNQISYYLKGELVSLLLDLLIRAKHDNQRSLDDVMRLMWQRFGIDEIGFTESQLRQTIAEVADVDLDEFFHRYVETTAELPFNDYLEPFGLHLKPAQEKEQVPYMGIKVKSENNREVIKFVAVDSPASLAGIDPNDELLAINDIRVTADSLNKRLQDYQAGDRIQVTIFHQDELKNISLTLTQPQPTRYQIEIKENLSATQQQNLWGWLGK